MTATLTVSGGAGIVREEAHDVALAVLAGRVPPHGRNRRLALHDAATVLLDLAQGVLDGGDAHGQRRLLDVAALEERAVDAGLFVARGRHAVVGRRTLVALELPAEDVGVKALGAIRVVDRD